MASITEFALGNTRLTAVSLLLAALLGVVIFLNYPSREDPSITIRQASVTTSLPGLSPTRVEDLITRPIEEKIREIPEVKHIHSDSKTGVSLITVDIKDSVDDLEPVWQDLRDKMEDVARVLPSGTHDPIVNDQVGLTAIATIALWADGFSLPEMHQAAKRVRDDLYALPGVRKIDLYGVQDERIYLEFSRRDLTQLDLDPAAVEKVLREQNIVLPGGEIDADGRSILLEPSGNFESVADIADVLLPLPDGGVVRLGDVASLRRGLQDPPDSPVYFNGRPAIVLGVSILEGVNSVQFGRELRAAVKAIEQDLPWGLVLDFATFQPDLVDRAVGGAVNNLYQTLAIVLLVTMLFLGLRTGLIVGAFVPFTMLVGIVVMRLLDVELQRVSIAALIIALGMLVDNGIVVAEDIRVRMGRGVEKAKAAIEAGRSLAVPLLTSSLTTILFFVPMALAEGGAGEYTGSLAQVIGIVLLASWFLALFMTPTVGAWFLTPPAPERRDGPAARLYQGYETLLRGVLRFRFLFLTGMLALLLASGYGLTKVEKEFFPLGDRNQYLIYLDLPAGSSSRKTDDVVQRVTRWLSDRQSNPEIASNVAYVSSGGPRFFLALSPPDPDPHKAFIVVNAERTDQVDALVARSRAYLLENVPEARAEAKKMWMGASETGLYAIRLSGRDERVLLARAERLLDELQDMPGLLIAKQDWENPVITLDIAIDQAKARAAGLSSQAIADSLQGFFSGATLSEFREGDLSIPIVTRALADERSSLNALQAISIYAAASDTWIPLGQVADIEGEWRPGRIKRRDQVRTLTVSAKHESLGAPDLHARLLPVLEALDLPPGHRWELAGEMEDQAEAQGNLFANLPMALGVIVLLLIWQFNSIRRAGVILCTIPLIVVGATLGLVVMQAPFGFMVILGFFSLAGIIINNGIVLIDRIDQEERAGRSRYDAVIEAARARLRPILLTTLTTVLGLVPLILSRDPLFYGMASAIAFGLAVGTVLTLCMVPALYAVFYRIRPETTG